jgi:monoamine oxidase
MLNICMGKHLIEEIDYDIVIIGGGLCGLYAAYKLSLETNYSICIYEKMAYLGGRIMTKRHDNFLIEYGPTHFESGVQSSMMQLLHNLNIEVERSSHALRHDVECDVSAMLLDEAELFEKENAASSKMPDPIVVIMHAIKKVFKQQATLYKMNINEKNKDKLKRIVREKGKFNGKHLHDWGIHDLFKEVLSEECLNYVLQEGQFYYMIDQNPNAAEHICMFIDMVATFRWDFVSIKGGMHSLISALEKEVQSRVQVVQKHELIGIEALKHSDLYRLNFNHGTQQVSKVCRKVILTTPPDQLCLIHGIPRHVSNLMKVHLKRVQLFKVFVIIENPPWNEGTFEIMTDIPCREVQQFIDHQSNEGMIVFYGDEPYRKMWFKDTDGNLLSESETNIVLRNTVSDILRMSYPGKNDWKIKIIEINDWFSKPQLGMYLWKPGVNSGQIIAKLSQVSIGSKHDRNIHICGETFSDFQCFMEGALRSADNVVKHIIKRRDSAVADYRDSFEKIFDTLHVRKALDF